MNKLWKFLKSVYGYSIGIITLLFTFIPESVFTYGVITTDWPTEVIIICNRILWLLAVSLITSLVITLYKKTRKSVTINGSDYTIVVEYGDLFKKNECNKVIGFDECYTTHVGRRTEDIKPESICGKFLTKFHDTDFNAIVKESGLTPKRKHSAFQSKECYESGSLVLFNDYLLLAFAKLNEKGEGQLSREEYLGCLDLMWKKIDEKSRLQSVAIPILGSGITRFQGENLTHQQLLDMIIASYKLSPYKLKSSAKLHIVCYEKDPISLNKIGEYI